MRRSNGGWEWCKTTWNGCGVRLERFLAASLRNADSRSAPRAVVSAALAGFESVSRPGEVLALSNRWAADEEWKTAAVDPDRGDTRAPRDTTPRYQTEEDRRLAESAGA